MKLCFLTGGPVSLRPVAAAPRATSATPAGQTSVTVSAEGQVSPVAGDSQASHGVTPSAQQGSLSSVPDAQQVSGGVTPSGSGEASEAQPVRRKRTSKVASALSLDAISEAEKSGPATGGAETLGDRIPDDTEILMHWREFPKEYASRPRLSTTLATAKVEILPKDGYKQVDFFVLNVAQQKWMEEVLLKELEWKLQKALKTSRIRLMVQVVPEENVEKKIYMPEDKAKVVMAENEEVQKLVKDFDLDVK